MVNSRNWLSVTTTMTVSPGFRGFDLIEKHLAQVTNSSFLFPTDLIGNVYARFKYEEDAQAACDALNSRWYAARPIYCELSPVTDFREACCRLNSGEGCVRGGFCNFIHRKDPGPELDRELRLSTKKWLKERGRDARSVSRSPSPEPTRRRF
jgi:splicing factor U2AF subunit